MCSCPIIKPYLQALDHQYQQFKIIKQCQLKSCSLLIVTIATITISNSSSLSCILSFIMLYPNRSVALFSCQLNKTPRITCIVLAWVPFIKGFKSLKGKLKPFGASLYLQARDSIYVFQVHRCKPEDRIVPLCNFINGWCRKLGPGVI